MGIAVVDHLAVLQTDDAVCLHGNGVIVGDEHHGVALIVQLLQHAQHFAAGVAVQCAGGLVGQDDRRVAHQCPRDGNALLLAAGKLVGLVFQLVAQAHLVQHFPCAGMPLGAGNARIHQRHLHVLHQVEPRQKIILLEDESQHFVADGRQFVAAHLAYVFSVQAVGARCGHIQAADDVHAGGFARTGLAHNGHELAFFDFHGDMVRRLYRGVAHLVVLADFIKLDQSAHFPSCVSSGSRHPLRTDQCRLPRLPRR